MTGLKYPCDPNSQNGSESKGNEGVTLYFPDLQNLTTKCISVSYPEHSYWLMGLTPFTEDAINIFKILPSGEVGNLVKMYIKIYIRGSLNKF